MITVWGRTTSSNVQTVMWAIEELGLEHERIDAGGAFGGLDTPEFGAMNPNRLVPVLRDDGEYLWESASIVRYLGARYGTPAFWPGDPLRRATLDKWGDWTKTTFVPALIGGVFWPIIGKRPEERDQAAIDRGAEALKRLALILDARMAQGDYLGGAELTFADVIVGTLLYRYFTLEIERAETPHLAAYYQRLTQRPAYAQHVMISYDGLRAK
ncbi:glutathione S-transferase family protein [Pseudaminobacter sp. NGMCC 1.201702]|uniref:glutathione S-transferase family protein n=1 Tax=Pseudaminobacter sp. NGMCC 1.201702 TaxID=3391825 RepID=UPI0039EF80C5